MDLQFRIIHESFPVHKAIAPSVVSEPLQEPLTLQSYHKARMRVRARTRMCTTEGLRLGAIVRGTGWALAGDRPAFQVPGVWEQGNGPRADPDRPLRAPPPLTVAFPARPPELPPPGARPLPPVTPMQTEALSWRRGAGW